MPWKVVMNSNVSRWKEIGVVVDAESGLAARVSIYEDGRVPLPDVQLGRLVFHQFVSGDQSTGRVVDIPIPTSLKQKIEDLLNPHLVDQNMVIADDVQGYELLEVRQMGIYPFVLGVM
jgi:hypothetical protein